MKALDCTVGGAGPPHVTRLDRSQYVHPLSLTDHIYLTLKQLFGGSAAAKEYIYKLTDYNSASWSQNFVASICGASASLVVSAPLDVIKTRIQNRNFENPESGFRIVSSMMKNEGFTSFFKGLTPKLIMTGPKLVFSFWLAQTLIPAFGKIM
jgi:hypothetical protein